MEDEIAWQEREIKNMKAVQQNASGSIATEYSSEVFTVSVPNGITTKTITFTPDVQCDFIQMSIAGYHDAGMTNPVETLASGIFSLGYLTSSIMTTSYQMPKSGNTFKIRLLIYTMKTDNPTVYLKATAIGERSGTFTIS